MGNLPRPEPQPSPQTYPDLASYLEGSGDTQANVARRVGVSQAHISRIVHGDAVPRALLAARLAQYARIPLDSFTKVHLAKRTGKVA
jgi:transcriptional regulator with XRE-family HTH domain